MDEKNFNSEFEGYIASFYDATSYLAITSVGLETAGAVSTASFIVDLSRYSQNTLWVESTSVVARAANTGLTVIMETRPSSAIGWYVFRTESGVSESGLSAIRVMGSGVADLSGVTHFKDVRITIENTTDSSGTATVQAWMSSRTPL